MSISFYESGKIHSGYLCDAVSLLVGSHRERFNNGGRFDFYENGRVESVSYYWYYKNENLGVSSYWVENLATVQGKKLERRSEKRVFFYPSGKLKSILANIMGPAITLITSSGPKSFDGAKWYFEFDENGTATNWQRL